MRSVGSMPTKELKKLDAEIACDLDAIPNKTGSTWGFGDEADLLRLQHAVQMELEQRELEEETDPNR